MWIALNIRARMWPKAKHSERAGNRLQLMKSNKGIKKMIRKLISQNLWTNQRLQIWKRRNMDEGDRKRRNQNRSRISRKSRSHREWKWTVLQIQLPLVPASENALRIPT